MGSVRGWSGADAYTVVLLRHFDDDVELQEQFYNAPSGTAFTLARDGYRVLDSAIASEPVEAAYPIEPLLSTGVAYRGQRVSDAPLPFTGRFSNEWVVWTRHDVAHHTGRAADNTTLLLHCRLPLPHNRTKQEELQQRYIRRHEGAASAALEAWWHTAPAEHTSRCLYGDGEKALTGAERYYELCPAGGMRRVQHHRLQSLLRGTAPSSMEAEAVPTVMEFLRRMHDSPSARTAILRDPRYRGVFEEVGRYHARYSAPRWNAEQLTWESVYPSTQPCSSHYTHTLRSQGRTPSDPLVNRTGAGQRFSKVRPDDAFWKTVVRFRCPSQRTSDEGQRLSTWAVTEVRQLCEYVVELMSDLVCGWEQELDSFYVNPIPCVALD